MKRPHRAAHARIWRLLAFALPLALIAALALRQEGPKERPAVEIKAEAGTGAPAK